MGTQTQTRMRKLPREGMNDGKITTMSLANNIYLALILYYHYV
jgi:hypothetical protein